MSHTTICPKCHQKSKVDESLIGRFVTCEHCRCLYYVVVPPLGEERTEWQSVPATSVPQPISGPASTATAKGAGAGADPVGRLTLLVIVSLILSGLSLALQIVGLLK